MSSGTSSSIDLLSGWNEDEGARDAFRYPALRKIHLRQALDFDSRLPKDGAVLDIGCGRNPLGSYLGDREIKGVDVDSGLVVESRMKDPANDYFQADVTDLPFEDASFQGCFMRGVIHHLPFDSLSSAFEEVRRVLDAGGILYILEPDPTSLYRRMIWSVAYRLGFDGEQTKEVHLSPDVIDHLLETAGFTVEVRDRSGSILTPGAYLVESNLFAGVISELDRYSFGSWWANTVAVNED